MRRPLYYGRMFLRTLPSHPRHFERPLPGPLRAQVQSFDRCNGECVMCPYPSFTRSGPPGRIDGGLYTRILKELKRGGTVRKFLPHLHSEPLLDARLEERIREAREILGPRVVLQVITNGSLLSRERAESLSRAGMDEITVSVDAFREETFAKIRPGFDLAAIRSNVEEILASPRRYALRMAFVRQQANEDEEEDFMRHWRSRGAGIEVSRVCNRVGSVEGYSDLAVARRRRHRDVLIDPLYRLFPGCLFPFTWLFVLLDGRVLLCCQDWKHEAVVGDLSRQSLEEVWKGDPMRKYRAALWERRLEEAPICSRCSIIRH